MTKDNAGGVRLERWVRPFPYNILENALLTDPEDRVVKRTIRERLWSWPWNPFRKTKVIVVQVPSRTTYLLMETNLVCHPVVAAEIRRKFNLPPTA